MADVKSQLEQPIIHLEHIDRFYGSGEAMVRACEDVCLDIFPGEYCAIMGQSGSGKSTMMNILGCLDRPTSGQYFLDGLDVSDLGKQRLARIRNQKIGFIFQRYELLASLTALENVTVPMMYAGVSIPVRRQRATEVLTRLGLGDRLHKKPSQLSGGQQQRVAIARAIVNGPKVLLADEPTGALDTGSATEVMQIFDALHQLGITIIMVTHAPELAEYSRRIIQMSDGRVLSDRPTATQTQLVSHQQDYDNRANP